MNNKKREGISEALVQRTVLTALEFAGRKKPVLSLASSVMNEIDDEAISWACAISPLPWLCWDYMKRKLHQQPSIE
ncbi:MAG: hypothetical protein AB7K24_18745 [Gemmataceae bacterium]